ncbi:MAG: hypothetical protein HQ546_10690 [Planctomycetes bacterium]|nr:hypothetical protein [Planctomycetota bacterium]
MKDRLAELLQQNKYLQGVICRDATLTDIELYAQTGYHIVWIDLEHGPVSIVEAIHLGRMTAALGMVPMVRIVEPRRSEMQRVLDGGFQIVVLPQVADSRQAKEFVQLGKYPPMGRRGVSTCSAGTDYTLGDDAHQALRQANSATHLMVQFEHDDALADVDAIVQTEGIDMVIPGAMDWRIGLGLTGEQAKTEIPPRLEKLFTATRTAGKTSAMFVASPDDVKKYMKQGVRIFFIGVDVAMKRKLFEDTLRRFQM